MHVFLFSLDLSPQQFVEHLSSQSPAGMKKIQTKNRFSSCSLEEEKPRENVHFQTASFDTVSGRR
jgi:hypothetical protein